MPSWRTADDVAAELDMTKNQLMRLVKRYDVPILRVNKRDPRFDPIALAALEEAVNSGEPPPPRPPKLLKARPSSVPKTMPGELLHTSEILAKATVCLSIPVVYFLIQNGGIVYVGKTTNLMGRLGNHARRIQFDSYHAIRCERDQLEAVERAYINALLPPLNRDGTTNTLRAAKRRKRTRTR